MEELKLKKEKQKQLKGLSTATYVIAKIGKICVSIAIPAMVIALVAVTLFMASVDVVDNEIVFNVSNQKMSLSEEKKDGETVLKVTVDNLVVAEEKGDESIAILKDFLSSRPKGVLIALIDTAIVLIIANLVIIRAMLKHLENLCKNISHESTPFTLDNVNHLQKMAYLSIATLVVSGLLSITTEKLPGAASIGSFGLVGIGEVLLLFIFSYIFEYGYGIQQDSQAKIYEESSNVSENKN